jgi:hypothetical protein
VGFGQGGSGEEGGAQEEGCECEEHFCGEPSSG